jgi:iron(III) transport system permease protein
LLAALACLGPVLAGFLVPVLALAAGASRAAWNIANLGWALVSSSMTSLVATFFILTAAVTLGHTARQGASRAMDNTINMATIGYSVPGPVIALGALIPIAWLDRQLLEATGHGGGLLLLGSGAALVFALTSRFFAVGYHPVHAGLSGSRGRLSETARSLGSTPRRVLFRVELPAIRGEIVAAGILLLVELLKELPITLILRPFNFHTLATRSFELASDERMAAAAPYALSLVALCAIAVFVLLRMRERAR